MHHPWIHSCKNKTPESQTHPSAALHAYIHSPAINSGRFRAWSRKDSRKARELVGPFQSSKFLSTCCLSHFTGNSCKRLKSLTVSDYIGSNARSRPQSPRNKTCVSQRQSPRKPDTSKISSKLQRRKFTKTTELQSRPHLNISCLLKSHQAGDCPRPWHSALRHHLSVLCGFGC